jgi:hypothetical protein
MPIKSFEMFNLPKTSNRTMALGFTQPPTEMNIRNIKIVMFLESKMQPVRNADKFTAIGEPIV